MKNKMMNTVRVYKKLLAYHLTFQDKQSSLPDSIPRRTGACMDISRDVTYNPAGVNRGFFFARTSLRHYSPLLVANLQTKLRVSQLQQPHGYTSIA